MRNVGQCYLGIDISKGHFDVVLLGGQQSYRGQFSNDQAGYQKLARWLKKREARPVHTCMEATGRYWEALALFLIEAGHRVSVVNPKLIKRHAEAIMQRNKTDAQDAYTLADYCRKHQPDLWEPPAPAYRQLKEMVRHVTALKADRQRERNRLQSGLATTEVMGAIEDHITFLDEQIEELERRIGDHISQHPDLKQDKELLTSIPGIGDVCALAFMAEIPDVSRFDNANQVAAFTGLTPGQRESGTSLSGSRLVKWGNSRLRALFFMPALRAHTWNPIIAALRQRLLDRGKSKMTVAVAVMRKMVHLCFGVLKTRKPFDPNHAVSA